MDEHYVWTVTGKTIEELKIRSFPHPGDELCREVSHRHRMRFERNKILSTKRGHEKK